MYFDVFDISLFATTLFTTHVIIISSKYSILFFTNLNIFDIVFDLFTWKKNNPSEWNFDCIVP